MTAYATLATLKSRLGISDTTDDAALETAISAASLFVSAHTGRRFYSTTETRYYSATDPELIEIDDCLSVSSVITDDGTRNYATAWTTTDWELWPTTAPHSQLWATPTGSYSFPAGRRNVKITGDWGYSYTAPEDIVQATELLAMRLWKRSDAIFGVAAAPALGVQVIQAKITADADVETLLAPHRRLSVAWQ